MEFMNKFDRTASHIAHFTDFQLKKGFKTSSMSEVNDNLTEIVKLFCCLQGRDIFIKAYTSFLAKRLLN